MSPYAISGTDTRAQTMLAEVRGGRRVWNCEGRVRGVGGSVGEREECGRERIRGRGPAHPPRVDRPAQGAVRCTSVGAALSHVSWSPRTPFHFSLSHAHRFTSV
eukprot:1160078-Rhodomonas_salina.1